MPIFDISVGIDSTGTPVYAGDPGIEIAQHAAIARGDAANVTLLRFGAHTGTHVDAPAHFIEGATKVADLPLDALVGRARVARVADGVRAIDAGDVEGLVPHGTERVLFKTRNSALWSTRRGVFCEDFTYITGAGARSLVERGVRLVGIDYLTIDSPDGETGGPVHHVLCGAGVAILEVIDLSAIAAGRYTLASLPIKLDGSEAAPARAILIEGVL